MPRSASVEVAYIGMINEQGGINGRKIKLLSLDDGYSPPKTVEQTRKLVEEEGVACIFQQLGTPCAMATRKYLNMKKVPQIFVASGATQFGDPQNFPWTIGWQVSYQIEGRVYARYILDTKPDARIAMLYPERRFRPGFPEGFQGRSGRQESVSSSPRASYEPTDPTVDSQVVQLQIVRRRRAVHGRHSEVQRHDAAKSPRPGLGSAVCDRDRRIVGVVGPGARRAGQGDRPGDRRVHERPVRSAMERPIRPTRTGWPSCRNTCRAPI